MVLSVLAAEVVDEGVFAGIAEAWGEGGWPMYPIALVFITGLAITVERAVALFATSSINKEGFMRGLKKQLAAGDIDQTITWSPVRSPRRSRTW